MSLNCVQFITSVAVSSDLKKKTSHTFRERLFVICDWKIRESCRLLTHVSRKLWTIQVSSDKGRSRTSPWKLSMTSHSRNASNYSMFTGCKSDQEIVVVSKIWTLCVTLWRKGFNEHFQNCDSLIKTCLWTIPWTTRECAGENNTQFFNCTQYKGQFSSANNYIFYKNESV